MSEGIYIQVQWIYHKIIHLALPLRICSIIQLLNIIKIMYLFLTNGLQERKMYKIIKWHVFE